MSGEEKTGTIVKMKMTKYERKKAKHVEKKTRNFNRIFYKMFCLVSSVCARVCESKFNECVLTRTSAKYTSFQTTCNKNFYKALRQNSIEKRI